MIRIIGGKHRSRMIKTPTRSDVLPTKNMVREAIFSSLGRLVNNAVVLDLFAGSGALGLEALSRGASFAYFADAHPEPMKTIVDNIATLAEKEHTQVRLCDYQDMLSYLENSNVRLNIVFVDPPYESGYYENLLPRLLDSPIVVKGGKLVVESRYAIQIPQHDESLIRRYRYGQTHVTIITK